MKSILEQAKNIETELKEIRRHIHQNPEVGACLPATKQFVIAKLTEYGYEPQEICESGIVAILKGKNEGKTMMLRADMDALPISEETGLEYRSSNGNMHACGHDMHTTMLLGAAKLLKANQALLNGTVKLVFQPDEEGFTGAKKMLEAGVLDHPRVDAAMALHVHAGTPTNTVLYGQGVSIAGCHRFRITVNGTGCHGAMPETGVDPINIAAHIYFALQELVAREIPATESVVLTIGKFAGGDVPNVIPSEVILEGTLRYLNKELGEGTFARMGELVQSMAKAFRGMAKLEELSSVPPLKNDKELSNQLGEYIKEVVGDHVISFTGGGMGSEDFASYSQKIPCAYFMLGAGTESENSCYGRPMHNSRVIFNEEILSTGAAIFTQGALKWLDEQEVRD